MKPVLLLIVTYLRDTYLTRARAFVSRLSKELQALVSYLVKRTDAAALDSANLCRQNKLHFINHKRLSQARVEFMCRT